jgi:hypothetical protein
MKHKYKWDGCAPAKARFTIERWVLRNDFKKNNERLKMNRLVSSALRDIKYAQ